MIITNVNTKELFDKVPKLSGLEWGMNAEKGSKRYIKENRCINIHDTHLLNLLNLKYNQNQK